jgi:hypothetical protein
VVQLLERANGKKIPIFSMTVDCNTGQAMRIIQEAFADQARKYRRATDNPLWNDEA